MSTLLTTSIASKETTPLPRLSTIPIFLFLCHAPFMLAQSFVPIQNESFETATLPYPGGGGGPYCNLIVGSSLEAASGSLSNWTAATNTSGAAAGAFAPTSGGGQWTSKWWVGNNIGYLQLGSSGLVSLSQTLAAALQNNTTYSLSALIGRRLTSPSFNYSLQLWAGQTILASANNLNLPVNSSGTDSVAYFSGQSNAQSGQLLRIVLSSTGTAGIKTEAFFDNISLTASTSVSVSSGGVVSASAFGGFSSIAPGSWLEIYGSNLASTTRAWAGTDFNGVNAPTSLSGTTVTVGGQAAFVDYVSPSQVNVQVPSNVGPGAQAVIVTTASGTSAAYTIAVNATQPGLLAPSSFIVGGKQYVVALYSDGATYVLPPGAIAGVPSRRARPGDSIVLYGVGFGPVTPNIPAGQIAQQINAIVSPLQVFVGGVPATLSYSGLAPGYVGLYQLNVSVPNVQANDVVPVTFTLGGNPGAQTLYIAVQN